MDYEKAYKFLQEDIKDIIERNEFYSNHPNDVRGQIASAMNMLLFQTKVYEDQIDKEVEITDYKLKGWDWEELADKLNIQEYIPDDEEWGYLNVEDTLNYNKIKHFIMDNYDNEEVVEVIKEHLRSMIDDDKEEYTHYDAVWDAMLNIEDNIVFMQFVMALLGHMWT